MIPKPVVFGPSNDTTFFSIFSPEKFFIITKFQRPYTWDRTQRLAIVNDLKYLTLQEDQGVFEKVGWPSILLQKNNDYQNSYDHYEVGDGQQRITSAYLCLLAIWHRATDLILDEGSSEFPKWLMDLMPYDTVEGDFSLISIASDAGRLKRFPKIRFNAREARNEIKRLIVPLKREIRVEINELREKSEREPSLLEGFYDYYNYFEPASLQSLELYTKHLLEDIYLTALIYEEPENMQRAFGNQNSIGVPLTEPQLIKAHLYGEIKKSNPNLADKIATLWTDELEAGFWIKELSLKGRKSSQLEEFLIQFNYIVTQWTDIDSNSISEKYEDNRHWLRDSIHEQFFTKTSNLDIERLWDRLIQAKNIYAILIDDTMELAVDSWEWTLRYAYNMMGAASGVLPSLLMALERKIEDREELKNTLHLLVQYNLYLGLYNSAATFDSFNSVLLHFQSPLKRDRELVSKSDFETLFWNMKTDKEWQVKAQLKDALSYNIKTFKPSDTKIVLRAFTYIHNEKARANNEPERMISVTDLPLEDANTLEHILPQKPPGYKDWRTSEQSSYDLKVNCIGNFLILTQTVNSKGSNKEPREKISIYENEKASVFWPWTEDFLDSFEDEWDLAQIKIRANRISKEFAQYFSANKNELFFPAGNKKILIEDNTYGIEVSGNPQEIYLEYLRTILSSDKKSTEARTYMAAHSDLPLKFLAEENLPSIGKWEKLTPMINSFGGSKTSRGYIWTRVERPAEEYERNLIFIADALNIKLQCIILD